MSDESREEEARGKSHNSRQLVLGKIVTVKLHKSHFAKHTSGLTIATEIFVEL